MLNHKQLLESSEVIELEECPSVLNEMQSWSVQQIEKYRDDKGWKLQHIAAYWGNLAAVIRLIRFACDFEEKIHGKTATELAYERGHYEVIMELLKASNRYPSNFNRENVSDELKTFIVLSDNLHVSIRNQEISNIEQTLNQNSNLKYFYDIQNKSAVKYALEYRKFESYETLVSRGLSLGPFEDFNEIISDYQRVDKSKLFNLQLKLAPTVLAEPMATYNKNSHFGPNCPNSQEHKNFVSEAYNFLFLFVGLTSVLNAVAASRTFKVVFDFSREAVTYIDPTSDQSNEGVFYFCGKIIIGALNMLNPSKKFEVFGTIAHEITHYAMYLTYDNWAKPYYKNDLIREKEFSEIAEECLVMEGKEKIVDVVFNAYDEDEWHAELIVRVPHMMAHYHNQPEILAERRQTFARLFNYYEQNCVPDMERALPKIEKKFRSEKEKKSERRKRNLWIVSLVFGLFLVFGLPNCIFIWLQSFSWDSISENSKLTVRDTSINYLGCEVKFSTIFPENSDIHFKLTSSEILGALWGSPFVFPKTVDEKKEKFVYLNGSNLPKCLEDKLLTSNVNFQGQNLTISELLTNKSRAFELLNSLQTVQILKRKNPFEISKKVEQKSKFYVEREFVLERCLKNKEGKRDFVNSTLARLQRFLCQRYNFSTILDKTQTSKMFFLSSPAGQGKSTTFRHFGQKLKEKWPQKWVEFVDLKKHLKAFEFGNKTIIESSEDLETFLSESLLNLTYFESAIFTEKFQNGDVIFLWDGIDEIAPIFKDFMLNLTSKFKNLTENWQFASTRPQHSTEFQKRLKISAFGLAPLDEEKKIEFLVKFSIIDQPELDVNEFYKSIRSFLNFSLSTDEILMKLTNSNDFSNSKVLIIAKTLKFIKNGTEILTSIDLTNKNLNPLKPRQSVSPILIEMAVEAAKDDNFTISQDFNTFLLYENFVNKKFDIALRKGRIVADDLNKWIQTETLTYKQAHQAFAMNQLFLIEQYDPALSTEDVKQFLSKKIHKILKIKSNVEISRFGILNVNLGEDFDFVHRTFAEFFVAKFLINNLIEDFTPNNNLEAKILLSFLRQIFDLRHLEIVRRFITDFLDLNHSQKHLQNHKFRMEKLRKLTEDQRIESFLRFTDLTHNLVEEFKIKRELIEAPDFIELPFNFILTNWKKFVEIFGKEKMSFGLEIRNDRGHNLLDKFCSYEGEDSVILLPKMLKLYQDNFNQTQLKEMLINKANTENILMEAVQFQNEQFLEILTTFIQKICIMQEEQNELLKMENPWTNRSALERSKWNKNVKTFSFVRKLYEDTLTRHEIQKLILTFNQEQFPFSFFSNEAESNEICIEISKFLFELFKDDILMLKTVFKRRAERKIMFLEISNGETILSHIRKKNPNCFEFYKQNWRKLYDSEEKFEDDFKDMLNLTT